MEANMEVNSIPQASLESQPSKKRKKGFNQPWILHFMVLPAAIMVFIFSYIPMSGILMAFQDYKPALGFLIPSGSDLSISGTCGRMIISCPLRGIRYFLLAPKLF